MARTQFVILQGKAKWVRNKSPNKWGNWSFDLYPTADSLEIIRQLQSEGIKNVLKKDEDGYYCSFSRPASKVINGKVQGFAPPQMVQADGETPLRDDVMVGNGSDVSVKLEVYAHKVPGTDKKAKAARWLAMKVDNLVPFIPEKDYLKTEQRAVKGLDTAPAQQMDTW